MNLMCNALAKLDAMPQSESDVRLNFLPFAHAYARTCELTTWLLSKSRMEIAHGISGMLQTARFSKPTLINGVPLFYDRLLASIDSRNFDQSAIMEILGSRIRRLASGGASMETKLRMRFAKAGLPIFQGYGLTEASPVVCSNRELAGEQPPILDECGPIVRGMDVRIAPDAKLWVSGNGVMLGYWSDPKATQARIVDGWLDTGDLAEWVHEEGQSSSRSIRILGRADDTIVLSNGYKLQPASIERELQSFEWIANCLLVGTNRPFPVLLLRRIDREDSLSNDAMLNLVCQTLSRRPSHAIPRAIIEVYDKWGPENGLSNFKGGLQRRKIEFHYQTEIEAAFQFILNR